MQILLTGALATMLIAAAAFSADSAAENDTLRRAAVYKMYEQYKLADFKEVPEISVAHVLADTTSTIIFLDVRSKKEIAVSRIPAALTVKEFLKRKPTPINEKVVVYCTIGYRSGKYAQTLRQKGVNAYNLAGGVLAWAHEGRSFVNAQGPTDSLHVYGKEWDLAPQRCTAIW